MSCFFICTRCVGKACYVAERVTRYVFYGRVSGSGDYERRWDEHWLNALPVGGGSRGKVLRDTATINVL